MLMESTMTRPPRKLADVLVPSVPINPLIAASFPLGRAWFVAVCSPFEMHWTTDRDGRGYFPVERRINELGFETYAPVERKMKIIRHRKCERVTPLFGCYIFIRFDREADDWGDINPEQVRGAHGILKNLDMPARVPNIVIDRLHRAEDAGAFDYTKPSSAFIKGDMLEIQEGPYKDFIGKVKSAEPRKKVKLLMDRLGVVEIDPQYLAKVG